MYAYPAATNKKGNLMKIHQLYKLLSIGLTLFILSLPIAKADVGNPYCDPSLEKPFANRPLGASGKGEVKKVLDSLHVKYLSDTNQSFINAMMQKFREAKVSSSKVDIESRMQKILIGQATKCLTSSAMERLDAEHVFNNISQLPQEVLNDVYFEQASKACYSATETALDQAIADQKTPKYLSVNELILNYGKYETKVIPVSGFFLFDQYHSLLLQSQNSLNRVSVYTFNLSDKDMLKVMECTLGCNLKFEARVDIYDPRNKYNIGAVRILDWDQVSN